MTEPKVTVLGLRELTAALRAIDPQLARDLVAELTVAAEHIADQARGRMPSLTGRAAGSVKARKRAAGAAIAFGGSAAPYEPWLDFGGGKKHARGVTPSAGSEGGRRPWEGNPVGEGRYVYPAISANKVETAAAVERAVTNAARKAGFEVR